MKLLNASVSAVLAAAISIAGTANAQSPPAGTVYYENTPWPLPRDGGTSTFRLTGMTRAHVVWMAFTQYVGGKPVMDSAVITLLPGSIAKWSAPEGGCGYELELVNSNPPVINMRKPPWICSLAPGTQAIFRIVAAP